MLRWLAVALGVLVPTSALAQGKDFRGFSVAAGAALSADFSSADATYNYTNLFAGSAAPPGFVTSDTYGLNTRSIGAAPFVTARYTFGPGGPYTLGVAVTLDLVRPKTTLSSSSFALRNPTGVADNPSGFSTSTTVQPKFHWSVALEPGYAINDRLMGFLILGFHQVRADISSAGAVSAAGIAASSVLTNPAPSSATFSGYSIGLGARHLLPSNWFVDSSVQWTRFGAKTFSAPTLISTADEITVLQSQRITLAWLDVRLALGFKF